MQYKEADFQNLKFPVFGFTEILEAFPRLASFPEFQIKDPTFDIDKVIQYVAFCYDIESPFVKEYATDIVTRKNLSAKYAGFPKTPGTHDKWLEQYQEIIDGKNSLVIKMVVRYIRLLRNLLYQRFVTLLENYHALSVQLMLNTSSSDDDAALATSKKKGDLDKQLESLLTRIFKLESELFHGETGFVSAVEDMIEDEVPLGFAELYAKNGNLDDLRSE